ETNGKSKNYLGVNKVDASAYAGQASIIGGDLDDKIIAAQGATSVWGGDSGDDILFGTGSGNTFFYFRGNGNDQIRNAADGDVVNLGDITLADIISTEVMGSGAKFDFNDGGSLTVLNAGDVTYKLGDGSSWKANYSSREWEQQA
ncbi:MAG: hypothetical protein IJS69_03440, partial [Selenomonadaceae bacterium]|nr:hypothetical protein [Selenomonadaceae bacterium]